MIRIQPSISSRPEILFQSNPKVRDPDEVHRNHKASWTRSHQSYQYIAGREYYDVIDNPRRTKHEVIINYWDEFFIQQLIDQFTEIKDWLRKHGVIAYSVAEITRDRYKKVPINQLHRHLLVDSDDPSILTEDQLREIFKSACRSAGLQPDRRYPNKNCEVKYREIQNRDNKGRPLTPEQAFRRRVKYILKYDIPARPPILFQPKTAFPHLTTGINKVDKVGRYFVNEDGTKAKKGDLRKDRRMRRYPESVLKELIQEAMQFQPSITINSGLIQVTGQGFQLKPY